ncbi:PREDICTED: uncharacterized protein LOC109241737 [Nicotiana attenuata]|uniref:TOD1/MUCI70 glycosyltransferase-like domain-containing protein n=1 Tax=Nicotiana attenuata TaxID=49451 RepID=A0A314L546_NICAT|nr:PREDICTED: uncharacterized protein LOC109241737 [Nicotiana attenuata]XP_019264053.1 PREDICTED: uncharacterized protein LOC109241737 [Nicotiana attenuata]OIT36698.1 hypothetical protein A4A49_12693 [Nicotiana attenuata]
MAQYRQSGGGLGFSNNSGVVRNGVASDHHVSIGIRSNKQQQSRNQHRRLKSTARKISIGAIIVILFVAFVVSVSAFFYFTSQNRELDNNRFQDDVDVENDSDFLTNVTRTQGKVLQFGHGSVAHGRDSRYWDKDDRRRDDDYNEEDLERITDGDLDKNQSPPDGKRSDKKSLSKGLDHGGNGLYNEAGRDELKKYEAKYQASLENAGHSQDGHHLTDQQSDDADKGRKSETMDADDGYDDGIDLEDAHTDGYDDVGHEDWDHTVAAESQDINERHSLDTHGAGNKNQNHAKEAGKTSKDFSNKESSSSSHHPKKSSSEKRPVPRRKPRKHACEMKILNASALIVEPLESRKFARFSLQYTETEDRPVDNANWEPRFAGHQSLEERKESFLARNQKINCGFVGGPEGTPSTGFDLAEDDAKYISSCHIAVVSCIFGNSDRLRIPVGKMVSRVSKKNVCFVMFVDEVTLQTLSAEGKMPDSMGFVGLWKIVVVKNLPYSDMRRVGKIPKLLSHRLFTSARYSIWLDSKLRLQLDPLLILEYFLWRKGYEYAISNHYDRHCVWEEVAQNKKLNKYNHTVIDEQFAFYQADGLQRFNASDPNKLLHSNVPEGSFIVRAHTPMSNLFSCLWFNEVERFTPRDQLSFAYTYYKLRRTNPDKPFYLNMFKDCERRKIAKLFRHRSDEKRNIAQRETE